MEACASEWRIRPAPKQAAKRKKRRVFRDSKYQVVPIVREVGFGNLAIGALEIWSLYRPGWIILAAIVGGLYYGLAALGHARKGKNVMEQTAMISDAFAFVVLLVMVVRGWA
jgi:hypothetical protein